MKHLALIFVALVLSVTATAADQCADLFRDRGAPLRPLETVAQLTIMSYNVEHLHVPGEDGLGGKPVNELKGLARAVTDSNPDFIVLEEVGGIDALKMLSRDYLGDAYEAYLTPGNDGVGGIDIGYLVKRDLPLSITLETHRDAMWKDPTDHEQHRVFTRDAPALLIRTEGAPTDSVPMLILIGTHAKAQRDRPGDPYSDLLRAAQFKETAKIVDGYQATYGRDVPILVGGDFNVDIQHSQGIAPLKQRLTDPFDVKKVGNEDRVTHTYIPKNGPIEQRQLDALMVTPPLVDNIVSIEAYRYKNRQGAEKPLPTSQDERDENPSDHFPVVLKLTTDDIFPRKKAVGEN